MVVKRAKLLAEDMSDEEFDWSDSDDTWVVDDDITANNKADAEMYLSYLLGRRMWNGIQRTELERVT